MIQRSSDGNGNAPTHPRLQEWPYLSSIRPALIFLLQCPMLSAHQSVGLPDPM